MMAINNTTPLDIVKQQVFVLTEGGRGEERGGTFLAIVTTSLVIMSMRAPISSESTSAKLALSLAILLVSASKVDQRLKVDLTSCLKE